MGNSFEPLFNLLETPNDIFFYLNGNYIVNVNYFVYVGSLGSNEFYFLKLFSVSVFKQHYVVKRK